MWDKKRLIYLVLVLFLISFQVNLLNNDLINKNYSNLENKTLNSSQLGSNYTLNIVKPDLFFIEGHLGINLSSTVSGKIYCALTEQSGEQYFIKINQSIDIIGNNQSNLIILKAIPLITTFPGEYHFTLNITGLFVYGNSFDMFLGMGYSLFMIILAFITIIVIIAIVNHRSNKKNKKPEAITTVQTALSKEPLNRDQMSCPNCKKIIDEGLSFCPECGERIPEFLRYNPK